MLSPIKNRRVHSRNCVLGIGLALFLLAGSSTIVWAQLPKSPTPPPTKAGSTDPLHRETPRSALEAFLKHEEREDFATAARYLQALPGQEANLPEVAGELRALHGRFKGDIALVSNEPDGSV